MATTNHLSSNVSEQLARVFTEKYESNSVLLNTVDTQLLTPRLTPASGGEVAVKRPTKYASIRTAAGDISGSTKSNIEVGKSSATVQDYITQAVEWENVEEALELDQLDQLLEPLAEEAVMEFETSLGAYMLTNMNLHSGTPGTAVTTWSDVANAGALMQSIGVPMNGKRYYVMNPFTQTNLADAQNGLTSGRDSLVTSAWENATISSPIGGLQPVTSNALSSFTSGTVSDRAGVLSGTPTATYVAHKDTFIQSIPVSGFGAGADTIKAGEIVQVTGRNRINLANRQAVLDQTGAQILWSGVVTADVTLTAGAGTLLVAGPAIKETLGQYDTVDTALTSGDVITLLGAASTIYQPNMFYHEKAFGVGFVKLPKLFSTDTVTTMKNGLSFRVSKYADGDTNIQKVRFDILPAFATFNPFFGGHGFG